MKKNVLLLVAYLVYCSLPAQTLQPNGGGEVIYEKTEPCVTPQERQQIETQLSANRELLIEQGTLKPASQHLKTAPTFEWFLQPAAGFTWNSYYAVNNFVDQAGAGTLLDYNCDMRTYDGHRGTDVDTWPYPWYQYDNDLVEVIASAPGTIIGKDDGQDDDHCACSGTWNAVYVEHSDGSIAWYGHLKKNSLTTKAVGQTVATGEYLGVLASSGCSTGPHIHFEVYDSGGSLIDPYAGACNSLNPSTWWTSQPLNREPTLNTLLTHDDVPVHGCPGVSEDPKIVDAFAPGERVYMAAYYHDQTTGSSTTFRVRQPDNTIWQSWNHSSPSTYTRSWWYWWWILPSGGPYGTWTFEADYEGTTVTRSFVFSNALPVEGMVLHGEEQGKSEVKLSWSTQQERNNSGFEIQRSAEGERWEVLDFVLGQGDSDEESFYQYLDTNPLAGQNYYRLQQRDYDGTTAYSNIVRIDRKAFVQVYPNPVTDQVYIDGAQDALISIVDPLGREVLAPQISTQINISNLPAGMYWVKIEDRGQEIVRRIVKQ